MKSATWPIVTIESIQAAKKHATTGGPFGSKLGGRDYVEAGVPVIRGTNLPLDSRFSLDDFVFVTEEKADSLIANNAHPGDVVFTQRGTLGQVGVIPKSCGYHRFVISQSQMKLTVDESQCDPEFVYYFFRSEETVNTIKGMSISAGVPHINLTMLREFPIPKPPLPLQRKIASILSAYDDLIENNTRRIAILEEMAQAIYREWFVNFRFPGHENVKLVDSPLGQIPEGWEVGKLEDVLILQRGFDLPKKSRVEGDVPIYASTGVTGLHNEAKVTGPGVLTGRSGSLGTVTYIHEDFWPLNTTLWIKKFKWGTPVFAYYVLSGIDFETFNSGAAVPSLNRNNVHGLPTLLPNREVIAAFDEIAIDIFDQAKLLRRKNENLRTTRDLLLPKLISGKLDVEDLDIDSGLTAEALEEATA